MFPKIPHPLRAVEEIVRLLDQSAGNIWICHSLARTLQVSKRESNTQ